MNKELFTKHFSFQSPGEMLNAVYNTDNEQNNSDLINLIKSELNNLKDIIKKMFEDDIKIGKPYEIVDSVQKILEFNRQNQKKTRTKYTYTNSNIWQTTNFFSSIKCGK